MDGIFRKQVKADDSDSDLLVPEEPEDCGAEPELSRGGIVEFFLIYLFIFLHL